jgi:hypothetical protein
MATYQKYCLIYALIIFVFKLVVHFLGIFARGETSFYIKGGVTHFILSCLDLTVIVALINILV